eukprot:scaffold14886_cov44-Attheya_sp.AAC.3
MSNESRLASALEEKERGNACYQSFRFADAVMAYTSALLKLDLKDNGNSDTDIPVRTEESTEESTSRTDDDYEIVSMQAVLLSNRANCRMEQGNYAGAAQDSQEALRITHTELDPHHHDETTQALRSKNLWRLARSLYYSEQRLQDPANPTKQTPADDGVCRSSMTLEQLVQEHKDDAPFHKKASKLLKAQEYTKSIRRGDDLNKRDHTTTSHPAEAEADATQHHFKPQIIRSSLNGPLCEYYSFGHDRAESALTGLTFDNDNNSNGSSSNDVRILYGGVGDGRHVLTTILDAACIQRKDSAASFKLHATMNDLNAQVLVKDILTLVVSHRIDKALFQAGGEMTKEIALLNFVLYFGLHAYAMPAVVYGTLQLLVKELFLDSTCKTFCEAYPWIHIEDQDWKTFQRIASYWVDISKYSPSLPTTERALVMTCPDPVVKKSISSLGMMGGDMWAAMERRTQESKARKRATLKEQMNDFSVWPAGMLERYKEELGGSPSRKEIMDHLESKVIDKMVEDDGELRFDARNKNALAIDKAVYEASHIFMIPYDYNLPEFEEEIKVLKSCLQDVSEISTEAFAKRLKPYTTYIYNHWHVNPVKYDPDWRDDEGSEKNNYVVDWADYYYHEDVRKLFHKPHQDEGPYLLCETNLFECVLSFYSNVGHAINQLVTESNLTIELKHGSILGFGNAMKEPSTRRSKSSLPLAYDRIYLSNVPDYTGMLSIFIELRSLLQKKKLSLCDDMATVGSSSIPETSSTLQSNVLLNTGLFQNYDEYVFGTMALSAAQVPRFLKMRVLNETPDVWNDFNLWGLDDSVAKMDPVGPSEFKTWLHRLFLLTVLPSQRSHTNVCREERPNTTGLFLQTCTYCVKELGYPIHWVSAALDQLLAVTASNPLKTKAAEVNKSPSPIPTETLMNEYNMTSFRLELENQLGLFIQSNLFPSCVLTTQNLPVGKPTKYQIKTTARWSSAGVSGSSSLGFLLEKKKNPDFDAPDDFMSGFPSFMSMMICGDMGDTEPSKLRQALLKNGSHAGHLFSCVDFRDSPSDASDNNCTLTFWMCQDVYEKHKDHHFSLVRTDGWFRLDHDSIRLSDAKPLL